MSSRNSFKKSATPPDSIALGKELVDALMWQPSPHKINVPKIMALIDAGADVNVTTNMKGIDVYAPLYWAAFHGNTDIARRLIEKGAKLDYHRKYQTPLFTAIMHGDENVALLLINSGVPLEFEDGFKNTPLHDAASRNCPEVVRLLIEKGANVQARNYKNCLPLHCAATAGNIEIAALLLAVGDDIEAQGFNGDRPLHDACYADEVGMISFLLEKGADINARETAWDSTPLHAAVRHGRMEAVKLMVERGADLSSRDQDNYTPESLARLQVRDEMADFLQNDAPKIQREALNRKVEDIVRQPMQVTLPPAVRPRQNLRKRGQG